MSSYYLEYSTYNFMVFVSLFTNSFTDAFLAAFPNFASGDNWMFWQA